MKIDRDMYGEVTSCFLLLSSYWVLQFNFHESDDIGPQEEALGLHRLYLAAAMEMGRNWRTEINKQRKSNDTERG